MFPLAFGTLKDCDDFAAKKLASPEIFEAELHSFPEDKAGVTPTALDFAKFARADARAFLSVGPRVVNLPPSRSSSSLLAPPSSPILRSASSSPALPVRHVGPAAILERTGGAEAEIPFIYTPRRAPHNANFIVLGCAASHADEDKMKGKANGEKTAIANLIAQDVAAGAFSALLFTGDNIYKNGASSPIHPWKFRQSIERYYSVGALAQVPIHPVNGNHDLGIENEYKGAGKAVVAWLKGRKVSQWDRAMAPVLRSYLSPEISRNWIMPNRNYALDYDQVNLFFLDSNTFPFDKSAISWLIAAYRKLNPPGTKKWNCAVYHHSTTSAGKRALHGPDGVTEYDLKRYADPNLMASFLECKFELVEAAFKGGADDTWIAALCNQQKPLFKISPSFNQTLLNCFMHLERHEGIKMDLTLGAHDHNLGLLKHRSLHGYQIISGAAGDEYELQAVRPECLNPATQDWAVRQNGYVQISFCPRVCAMRFINHQGVELRTATIQRIPTATDPDNLILT